jgi:hypothetical protein
MCKIVMMAILYWLVDINGFIRGLHVSLIE